MRDSEVDKEGRKRKEIYVPKTYMFWERNSERAKNYERRGKQRERER